MPVSPITTNNCHSQPLHAAESKCVLPQVKDILVQAGSSSDGCIMSILKPIGRFFNNIVSYFKHIFCCCPAKEPKVPDLPKFSLEQMEASLGKDCKVTKKSDILFAITYENVDFTVEFVTYGKSFAVQIEGGEEFWKTGKAYGLFKGTSAVILKGLKEEFGKDEVALDNGYVKEETVWVKKGPVSIVSCSIDGGLDYKIFFGGETSIHLEYRNAGVWVPTGLENCLQHLRALIKWAEAALPNGNNTLAVEDPSEDFTKELEKHGFAKDEGYNIYMYACK